MTNAMKDKDYNKANILLVFSMTNALEDKDYNQAKILLDLSPDTLTIYVENAMTKALKIQDYETAKNLLGLSPDTAAQMMIQALESTNYDTAKNLLDLSPDTLAIYTEQPMTEALKRQDYETAKNLLDFSPDTAAQMMIQALESQDYKTAKELLALSPNTLSKAKHPTGKTTLMYAVEAGDSQLVDSLLAANKTLNTLPEFGSDYTPLSRAVVSGNLKIVKRLLQDLGIDKTIQAINSTQGFQGKNLIEWATVNKHKDIIKYLTAISTILGTQDFTNLSKQEINKALTDKLIEFLDNQDYDTARILLDLSPDTLAKVKDSTEKTPLMHAAEAGNLDLATLLIQNGADVNAIDQTGKTPLMYAAEAGNLDLATLLIQNNADFTKENTSGKTAFDLARSQSQSKLPSTIEMAILKAKTKDWAQTHITPKNILISAISAISAAVLYSQYGPNTMEDEGGHHYS